MPRCKVILNVSGIGSIARDLLGKEWKLFLVTATERILHHWAERSFLPRGIIIN
jgi:hypothetical protein